MKCLWISCSFATVRIEADEKNIIRFAAPIFHRFVGQPYQNLIDWLESKYGRVTIKYLLNPNLMHKGGKCGSDNKGPVRIKKGNRLSKD